MATKRKKGETRDQCVSRKIKINKKKFKTRRQALAVSISQCK